MKCLNMQTHLFPWRPGNHVELFRDAPVFFPHMLASIAQAQRFVFFEIYLFESGSVATRDRM